jgi:hypothetical protein
MRALPAIAAVSALLACGGGTTPVRGPSALSYRFAFDEALSTLSVEVCPRADGWLPEALVPIHEAARAHLIRAELTEGGASLSPLAIGDRIALDGAPRGACARYVVDLAPRPLGQSISEPALIGEDLFAPSSVWLLAPSPRDPGARYRARFELPEGMSASPFWPTDSDGAWFDERAFSFVTYAAFGRLEVEPLGVPGGCIDIVTLDGELSADREVRARWISAAAAASARVTGSFPAPRATLLLVPGPPFPGMPVIFGVAGRGVRPSVSLIVSSEATEAQLVPDWTAVHELSHLLTGYAQGDDVWLSEGLATYYEEVLRARAGLISREAAWLALDRGFRRGAAEGGSRTLQEESSSMHAHRSYTRVYWAGAAIVLLADLAYRQAGGSLDLAVVRAWARREERMSARELMAALDGEEDGAFARVAAAALGSEEFPSLDGAYTWLGITRDGDRLAFDDAAPGAAVRDALMNDSPPLASIPPDCGSL